MLFLVVLLLYICFSFLPATTFVAAMHYVPTQKTKALCKLSHYLTVVQQHVYHMTLKIAYKFKKRLVKSGSV